MQICVLYSYAIWCIIYNCLSYRHVAALDECAHACEPYFARGVRVQLIAGNNEQTRVGQCTHIVFVRIMISLIQPCVQCVQCYSLAPVRVLITPTTYHVCLPYMYTYMKLLNTRIRTQHTQTGTHKRHAQYYVMTWPNIISVAGVCVAPCALCLCDWQIHIAPRLCCCMQYNEPVNRPNDLYTVSELLQSATQHNLSLSLWQSRHSFVWATTCTFLAAHIVEYNKHILWECKKPAH